MSLEVLWWGGLGLILGSFTNVLIVRHGAQSLFGRSACPQCKKTLSALDLVPVFSWLFLRGRCRHCGGNITIQYPLVELFTGALVLLIGLSPTIIILKVLGAAVVVILVAIFVYDLYYMLIPDAWAYLFGVLGLAYGAFAFPFENTGDVALFMLAGPLVAFPLAALWFVSRGGWMGLGEAKLMLGAGWLLGVVSGYVALGFAFVLGAFVGVCILIPLDRIKHRMIGGTTVLSSPPTGLTMKSEVPFGPFLITSICLLWFCSLYEIDVPVLLLHFLSLS